MQLYKKLRISYAIEEEGLLGMDDDDDDGYGGASGGLSGIPKRVRYALGFVGGFFRIFFFFFVLILWGASRNQRPVVTLRAITGGRRPRSRGGG
jgi:hypothetical protein